MGSFSVELLLLAWFGAAAGFSSNDVERVRSAMRIFCGPLSSEFPREGPRSAPGLPLKTEAADPRFGATCSDARGT